MSSSAPIGVAPFVERVDMRLDSHAIRLDAQTDRLDAANARLDAHAEILSTAAAHVDELALRVDACAASFERSSRELLAERLLVTLIERGLGPWEAARKAFVYADAFTKIAKDPPRAGEERPR